MKLKAIIPPKTTNRAMPMIIKRFFIRCPYKVKAGLNIPRKGDLILSIILILFNVLTIDCVGHDTLFFFVTNNVLYCSGQSLRYLYFSLHHVSKGERGYKKNLLTKYNTLLLCRFHNEKGENHEVEVLVVCNLFRLF